ncbi:DUF2062 domain-containing protein [Desulfosarcina sp. OttesenSCG-928-A07]|nr:DUF2062 domain-containing protein [Desulfosarcina sp. OttesenSCG-928-A07]
MVKGNKIATVLATSVTNPLTSVPFHLLYYRIGKAFVPFEVVPILPDWTVPGFDITAVMPSNRIPKRVRLFVDYLVEHFSRVQ